MSTLAQKIAAFEAARVAYEDAAPEFDGDPLWNAYEATEHAVVVHPCETLDEVRLKARYFLENDGPYCTIADCEDETGDVLRTFLRSLLGAGEVQPSPLVEAYRQWVEAESAFLTLKGDEAQERFCDEVLAPLDDLIRNTPARTAQELAMKFHVFRESREHPLNAEIEALISGEAWKP